jgi:hypothetical protein
VRRLSLGCRIWESELNQQLFEGGMFGQRKIRVRFRAFQFMRTS